MNLARAILGAKSRLVFLSNWLAHCGEPCGRRRRWFLQACST